MPRYEFECAGCGGFEIFRRYDEALEVRCPYCKGEVRQVFSPPVAFTFGWRLSDTSHLPGHKDELVRNI